MIMHPSVINYDNYLLKKMWIPIIVLVCAVFVNSEDIFVARERILKRELDMMTGSDLVLTDNELKANEMIMKLKNDELEHAFHHPQIFNVSKHFFDYKDEVKTTKLFEIIQRMPKGGALHVHDTGLLSPDYVLNLTYWEDLYVCFEDDDVQFYFSKQLPISNCGTQWQLMKDARYSSGNVEKFDAELRKHFTIVVDNPHEAYPDVDAVWKKFQQYFISTGNLMAYKPVWEKYFYDTLKAFREDNIMYVEMRSVLPELYDLDGNIYSSVETAKIYNAVVQTFVKDYPDFFGAKLIYAPIRMVDNKTVAHYIEIANEIKRELPDFFAGFDLVGQEDKGAPLKDFLSILVKASTNLDYFFHAGETNWQGTDTDENLVDAILLGTKRVGHGYALVKHPSLIEEIKQKDIAIEVNVVSNAILKLVADVRNHPLATFLAMDVPVVLSSDDPGIWEAEPLTHDFYVAFLGVASRHADLRLLKKLALNSLYYSSVSDKNSIVYEFEVRWTKFIDSIVKCSFNSLCPCPQCKNT